MYLLWNWLIIIVCVILVCYRIFIVNLLFLFLFTIAPREQTWHLWYFGKSSFALLNSLDFIIFRILKSILISHMHPEKGNACNQEARFDTLLKNFGIGKLTLRCSAEKKHADLGEFWERIGERPAIEWLKGPAFSWI